MFKQSVVLLSGLLSASAFAQWTLDQDNSALHFMSTKNAQVTEVHSFDHFSGWSWKPKGLKLRPICLNI